MVRKARVLLCTSLLATACLRSSHEPEELTPKAGGALVVPHWELAHEGRTVRAMALSADGREGWAVGRDGLVVRYNGKSWKEDEQASSPVNTTLISIWLSPDGNHGWIAGVDGSILNLREGKWERGTDLVASDQSQVLTISAEKDGKRPCVVDSRLRLWCLEGSSFKIVNPVPGALPGEATTVEWASSRVPGWAFVSRSQRPAGEVRAVREEDIIFALQYRGGQWPIQAKFDQASQTIIYDVWVSPDRSHGWAVGIGGTLLRLKDGQWSSAPFVTGEHLLGIAMTADGSRGWAVGSQGVVLAFDGQTWRVAAPPETLTDQTLTALWLQGDGSQGWIIDFSGHQAFFLKDGVWQPQSGFTLTSANLSSVWCEAPSSVWAQGPARSGIWSEGPAQEGTEILHRSEGTWKIEEIVPHPPGELLAISRHGALGWAVSGKQLLHYDGAVWKPWPSKTNPVAGSRVRKTFLSADGSSGLLLRWDGLLYRLRDGDWKLDGEAGTRLGKIQGFWLTKDRLTGWVSGESEKLFFLQDGAWTKETSSFDTMISHVLTSENGEGSLGFNGAGQAFRFSTGKWSPVPELSLSSFERFTDLWLSPDQESGWMVTERGAVWALAGRRWTRDEQASGLARGKLSSVCLAPDGMSGWAVGERGTILRYAPKKIGTAQLKPLGDASLAKLRGIFALSLPWELHRDELPKVKLVGDDETESVLPYEIEPGTSPREFRFRFKKAAAAFAESQKGKPRRLQIEARLAHASVPVVTILESDAFDVYSRPLWKTLLLIAGLVIAANLVLFGTATRIRWIRTMVLHPVGSHAIGLVLGKYLLTDWLIRFVLPLKLAMFRDYRSRVAKEPPLVEWDHCTYVPPHVSLNKRDPSQSGDEHDEEAWKTVFRELLRQPKRRLWLILGQSGLGKTALLEQWARLATELGETPFLIRLRNGPSPANEVAVMMNQIGDVTVTPDVARDLLTGGGFVILLDGYNEARSPQETLQFVRQVTQRNLVIMTSQFDPDWGQMVEVCRVYLEPFGRPQLCKILGETWVEQVLASDYLAEIARLPFTARLLAGYIERNRALPRTELEVYEDLRSDLDPGLLLNLEQAAWETFKTNETEISAGPKLPAEFCEAAVKHGILTRRARDGKESYRFVHERIHRLFVALYLERQDERPLKEWYKEVTSGLGRGYWMDVLDFRGQIKGRLALRGGAPERKAYRLFLRQVAAFSPTIFSQRLYFQYDRLCRAFPELDDPDFVRWAARVLAGSDPETA